MTGRCQVCGGTGVLWASPTGNWWVHDVHPVDDHDFVSHLEARQRAAVALPAPRPRRRQTIGLDFDATIHPFTAGWIGTLPADEPPVPGAARFLEWCRDSDLEVVIFSCRADTRAGINGIWAWLEQWGLAELVSWVTDVKPAASAYVDDRAVPFAGGSWEPVKARITQLRQPRPRNTVGPHWHRSPVEQAAVDLLSAWKAYLGGKMWWNGLAEDERAGVGAAMVALEAAVAEQEGGAR